MDGALLQVGTSTIQSILKSCPHAIKDPSSSKPARLAFLNPNPSEMDSGCPFWNLLVRLNLVSTKKFDQRGGNKLVQLKKVGLYSFIAFFRELEYWFSATHISVVPQKHLAFVFASKMSGVVGCCQSPCYSMYSGWISKAWLGLSCTTYRPKQFAHMNVSHSGWVIGCMYCMSYLCPKQMLLSLLHAP